MVFVKVMVFCWFLTKHHKKTIIFPTCGFGMVLINFSSECCLFICLLIESANSIPGNIVSFVLARSLQDGAVLRKCRTCISLNGPLM